MIQPTEAAASGTTPEFVCSDCGKTSVSARGLHMHKLYAHGGPEVKAMLSRNAQGRRKGKKSVQVAEQARTKRKYTKRAPVKVKAKRKYTKHAVTASSPSSNGVANHSINYCPHCGCNIGAVSTALTYMGS